MSLKITPSELLEYHFCPRFIYFMKVLNIPQYEDRRYKVQKGREIHEARLKKNKDYLWKKIGAKERETNVYLISENYHLYGLVDEVVTFEDESIGPIDYKFAEYPEYVYKSHKTQLLCYCMLIEEIYRQPVKRGYIFYIRSGSKQVEVKYSERGKVNILADIEDILQIIGSEKMPKPTKSKNRCIDCTYKNICVR